MFFAEEQKQIRVGGQMRVTGGITLDRFGSGAKTSAASVIDPVSLSIDARNGIILTGGMGFDSGTVVNASGEIQIRCGGDGLVLRGGRGTGMFNALGLETSGQSYPITVVGPIRIQIDNELSPAIVSSFASIVPFNLQNYLEWALSMGFGGSLSAYGGSHVRVEYNGTACGER